MNPQDNKIKEKIADILRNRLKFVGKGEVTYLGTPNEMIEELANLMTEPTQPLKTVSTTDEKSKSDGAVGLVGYVEDFVKHPYKPTPDTVEKEIRK